MLETAFLLLINTVLPMLRVLPTDSFPRPLTQRETAEACAISRSYVSRIEKRALEKLKAALE